MTGNGVKYGFVYSKTEKDIVIHLDFVAGKSRQEMRQQGDAVFTSTKQLTFVRSSELQLQERILFTHTVF